MVRPARFQIDRRHPLAQGLRLFVGGHHYGLTRAYDSSLWGNHGTLTNMDPATDWVWVPELQAWGLEFVPGSAQHIALSSFALDTSLPWTVSWWSLVDAYTDTYPAEWVLATDQATGFLVFHNTNNANYRPLCFGSSANFMKRQATTDWSSAILGVWQHYAITFVGTDRTDTAQYALYRNGVSEALKAPGGAFAATPNESRIGYGSSTTYEWDGQVSSFLVHCRKLTTSEIGLLASRDPMLGGLIVSPRKFWPVRAPSGAVTAKDYGFPRGMSRGMRRRMLAA